MTDEPFQAPETYQLPNGSRLGNPKLQPSDALQLRQWVRVNSEPRQITDLRRSGASLRVVHLEGHPPLILTPRDTLLVYTVTPAPGTSR